MARRGYNVRKIDPTWLYFTMPEGGTVTLTKNGTPTAVTLEYSLDNGSTWTEWVESENVRSLTLAAGQTVHVRNTSETSTEFSGNFSNNYRFAFTTDTYAGGDTRSLLCSIPFSGVLTPFVFRRLFYGCTSLVTAPELPAMSIDNYCYDYMFYGCSSLVTAPELPALSLAIYCYRAMFSGCSSLNKVTMSATDISATNCIQNWLSNVSPTGDFYCPAELTIPTGVSGIPSGWTRHDLPTT